MSVPPPPPPPTVFPKPEEFKITEIRKVTPEDLDEIIKRRLSLDETLKEVFYKTNLFLTPQLQDGPKCGLVALSIASSISKSAEVDEILDKAKCKNFTKQGEIFNADYLAQIAEECCGFTATVIEGGLQQHMNCIIYNLLNKNLILIPYDADHNHSPCLKKGVKAHWTLITGFVIFKSSEYTEAVNSEECDIISLKTTNSPLCNCCESSINSSSKLNIFVNEGNILVGKKMLYSFERNKNFLKGKIFLIGLQGKSKYMGLWAFDDMAESNDNLLYFSPDREIDDYVVPEGGPQMGLKGRAIILKCKSTPQV